MTAQPALARGDEEEELAESPANESAGDNLGVKAKPGKADRSGEKLNITKAKASGVGIKHEGNLIKLEFPVETPTSNLETAATTPANLPEMPGTKPDLAGVIPFPRRRPVMPTTAEEPTAAEAPGPEEAAEEGETKIPDEVEKPEQKAKSEPGQTATEQTGGEEEEQEKQNGQEQEEAGGEEGQAESQEEGKEGEQGKPGETKPGETPEQKPEPGANGAAPSSPATAEKEQKPEPEKEPEEEKEGQEGEKGEEEKEEEKGEGEKTPKDEEKDWEDKEWDTKLKDAKEKAEDKEWEAKEWDARIRDAKARSAAEEAEQKPVAGPPLLTPEEQGGAASDMDRDKQLPSSEGETELNPEAAARNKAPATENKELVPDQGTGAGAKPGAGAEPAEAKAGTTPPTANPEKQSLAAGLLESKKAKAEKVKNKLEEALRRADSQSSSIRGSSSLRLLGWIFPGVYAKISDAVNTGKNVTGAPKLALLEAKVLALKSAIESLEVAEGAGSVVDATKATIQFGIFLGEMIPLVGAIIVLLLSPAIILILALIYLFIGGGTITKIMKNFITKLEKILEPLEKELKNEKRKVKLRKMVAALNNYLYEGGPAPAFLGKGDKAMPGGAPESSAPASPAAAGAPAK